MLLYNMAYGLMPSQAASSTDAKQQCINGQPTGSPSLPTASVYLPHCFLGRRLQTGTSQYARRKEI